jgi:phosphatidylglycerophosphatase A
MRLKKLNEFLLTFFYVGKSKTAPGTFGSLAAVFLWLVVEIAFGRFMIEQVLQNLFWLALVVIFFAAGLAGIRSYSIKCQEFDHQSIVLDEVIGMLIALQITFMQHETLQNPSRKLYWVAVLFCFGFFRYFDIIKPGAIGILDRKMKNSFGVIFDDVMSGLISGGLANLALELGGVI